uniref:Uncharacterized protein n=1 Tax=Rhizophagus irregularis (strain DAOM 181602 / DAOM 197198 / MUCL 43194) TaxID=747089 RepID=U9UJP6_RHIID
MTIFNYLNACVDQIHKYLSQNLNNQISVTSLQETNDKMATKIKQCTQSLGACAEHLRNQRFDFWLDNHEIFLILLSKAKSNLSSK